LHVLREQFGFDYGKFDYTMVDGKAMPFDFNKTAGVVYIDDEFLGMVREFAQGIEAYFA